MRAPLKQNQHPQSGRKDPDYQLFERLKAIIVETLLTPAEYEAAIRSAAKIAGV